MAESPDADVGRRVHKDREETLNQHEDSLAELREILSGYLMIISDVKAVCGGRYGDGSLRPEAKPIDESVSQVLSFFLSGIVGSGGTLYRLSDSSGWHTRDCYGIVRSIVELSVNACYVMAEGSPMAQKALRHARQKTFRDAERKSEIGGNRIDLWLEGRPDVSFFDGLQNDLDEFSTRKGRALNWTDLSVEKRIAAVGDLSSEAMQNLQWAHFAVYGDSSEILHGSLCGVWRLLGMTAGSVPASSDELVQDVAVQHLGLLMYAAMALGGVVHSFHAGFGFDRAVEADKILINVMREVPWLSKAPPAN